MHRKAILAMLTLLSIGTLTLEFVLAARVVRDAPHLELTVATDKKVNLQGESVMIRGTLSLGTNPIARWLVAVSINTPKGKPLYQTTLETDQAGNFATTFNLPPESNPGDYTLLCATKWGDNYARKEATLKIQPQRALTSSTILFTLIATVAGISLVISTLILYGLAILQKKKP